MGIKAQVEPFKLQLKPQLNLTNRPHDGCSEALEAYEKTGCRCISWKEEKMMTSVHMFFFIKLALKKKEKNLAFQKHSFGLTILHFGHFSVLIAKKTELLSGNAFYILFADYLPFFHLFSSIVYVFDLNLSRDDIVIKSNRMTEQN